MKTNKDLRMQENKVCADKAKRLGTPLFGWRGELEFIRLARQEVARLDDQYKDLKRQCQELEEKIIDLGIRIVKALGGASQKRSASDMVIRVKGLRREQFQNALRLKSEIPTLSMYDIARFVMAKVLPNDRRDGYPSWKSLHRYMVCMNRKYGCFD